MLVVVFGAGASFDSIDPKNLRSNLNKWSLQRQPPLADELFGNRAVFGDTVLRYPAAAALMSEVRRAVRRGQPVEEALEVYRQRSTTSPRIRQQLAAVRFYLQDMLAECSQLWPDAGSGLTNYADLVDAVEEWRAAADEQVTYLTFNYDTILEQACSQQLGWQFAEVASYISWPKTFLIKLHGSVSWAHPVEGPVLNSQDHKQFKQEMIRLVDQLVIASDRFILVNNAAPKLADGRPAFPAIAIPLAAKDDFECPDEHLEVARRALEEAERLLLVGWRAADRTFLELMAKALKPGCRVQVVARADAQQIVDRLKAAGIPIGKAHLESGGFTRYVTDNAWSWLLGRADH